MPASSFDRETPYGGRPMSVDVSDERNSHLRETPPVPALCWREKARRKSGLQVFGGERRDRTADLLIENQNF